MGLRSRFAYQKYKLTALLNLVVFVLVGQMSVQVIDETNSPLIGVEVYTKDYSFTAISDAEGRITIEDLVIDKSITFSYLGFADFTTSIFQLKKGSAIVQLRPSDILMEEILLVGRTEMAKDALPYHVETINQAKIASTNPQTAADALAQHGNLYVQKSQMGGGSPVIRGFEANKVLLVLDGVRMNNAIYRNGHLQNAITVDQAMLEKMEVIFGPNSLTYGSDALGGVVHFKSRDPKLQFLEGQGLNTITNYGLRYSSANQEKTGHLDFNIGGKTVASLTSLSFSDFSDLRSGSRRPSAYPDFGKRLEYIETINGEDLVIPNENQNIQVGTAYSQFDLLQKVLYQPDDYFQMIANFQFSTSTDVPRYDQLIDRSDGDLRFAEWSYGPQNRFLASVKFKFLKPISIYDKAIFITSVQQLTEERIQRRVGRMARTNRTENVTVQSFTADLQKRFSPQHELFYGGNIQMDIVRSKAFDLDILTMQRDNNVFTRYPSAGSDMTLYGLYTQYHYSTQNDKGHLNLGVRASGTRLSFAYLESDPIEWPQSFVDGITSSNQSLIWSLGWSQRYQQGWNWRALVSSAFRSPNIDDMAKVRVNGDEVTFPNANLNPERSLNAEYSVGKIFGDNQGQITLTGFYTELSDAIVREPFTQSNGSSLFVSGPDTFFIFANVNAQKARIGGFSLSLKSRVFSGLTVETDLNWTKGRVIDELSGNRPLAHIPPLYGKLSLVYDQANYSLRAVIRYNGKKPLSEYGDSSDNPEYATPEGSLAWHTINVYSNFKLRKHLSLSLGIENLLDTHYRQFASGVSAVGINGIFSIKGSF